MNLNERFAKLFEIYNCVYRVINIHLLYKLEISIGTLDESEYRIQYFQLYSQELLLFWVEIRCQTIEFRLCNSLPLPNYCG